jgi:acetylglutamate kinase
MLTVLKLGGELLEDRPGLEQAGAAVARLASLGPLVVVHGGGRAIDAELRVQGVEPRFVDGLRITDEAALDAAVSVLAGRTNTRLVGAIGAAGVRAVGLTGADAGLGLSVRAGTFRSVAGDEIDLGLVGDPVATDLGLVLDLLRLGYVPVVASIGVDTRGGLLNVNADTLAGHLAAGLRADRLLIAGGTAGVLDGSGHPIARLGSRQIDAMIAAGTAHSGMVAKLTACRRALDGGVGAVAVVAGRGAIDYAHAPGTRIDAQSVGGRTRRA